MTLPEATSISMPATKAVPMPRRRGSRTLQKASTSATQSGAPTAWPRGIMLRKKAAARENRMNHCRTGRRMRRELWVGWIVIIPSSFPSGS